MMSSRITGASHPKGIAVSGSRGGNEYEKSE
jgi:hypothetical protein